MQTINLDELKLKLDQIEIKASEDCKTNLNLKNAHQIKAKYLGNKSEISEFKVYMKDLKPEDKPALGKLINEAQSRIETIFNSRNDELKQEEIAAKLEAEKIDISLPSSKKALGKLHPLNDVTKDIVGIFQRLGFKLVDGPELENTYYNFTALNTGEDHPARDEQDTFYTSLSSEILLRSHTSSIQIRAMEKLKPPFRIIGHGRVYRNEEVNARKMPFFHQLEIASKYSMLRARDRISNDWIIYMPADRFQHSLTYTFKNTKSFENSYVSIDLQQVMNQSRVPSNKNGKQDYKDPPPAYHLLALHASTKIMLIKQPIIFGLGVKNLLNARYRDYLNQFRYFTDDMGRNISFKITLPIHK
jgi:hypothetical protein